MDGCRVYLGIHYEFTVFVEVTGGFVKFLVVTVVSTCTALGKAS